MKNKSISQFWFINGTILFRFKLSKTIALKSYFIDEVFYYSLRTLSFHKLKHYMLIKFKCSLSWIFCLILGHSKKTVLNFENPGNDFNKCIRDEKRFWNLFLPRLMKKKHLFVCIYFFLDSPILLNILLFCK